MTQEIQSTIAMLVICFICFTILAYYLGKIIRDYELKKTLNEKQCKDCKHLKDCRGNWFKAKNEKNLLDCCECLAKRRAYKKDVSRQIEQATNGILIQPKIKKPMTCKECVTKCRQGGCRFFTEKIEKKNLNKGGEKHES